MLNDAHIKNKYFLCSYDKISEIFEQIKKYYDNYYSIENVNPEKILHNGIDLKTLNYLKKNIKTRIEKIRSNIYDNTSHDDKLNNLIKKG